MALQRPANTEKGLQGSESNEGQCKAARHAGAGLLVWIRKNSFHLQVQDLETQRENYSRTKVQHGSEAEISHLNTLLMYSML